MDINDLRSLMTVLSLVTFLGIFAWAWSSCRKAAFDEAARLVFDEDDEYLQSHNRPAAGR